MSTWNKFAWAVFLYGVIGGDRDYQSLMNKTQLLSNLKTNPSGLDNAQIQKQVIKGFLNRWKCRVHNNTESANAIKITLQNLIPYLQVLNSSIITNIDFNLQVNVNNDRMSVSNAIEHCYMSVRKIGFNFGPTATSKLLHIIQPELFIMWDRDILNHYRKQDQRVSDNRRGYCAYLELMQQMATQISANFHSANLNPPKHANQDPANYLSAQMNYNPPKTLAKYLDEYNWVTITNKVLVPPHWHPQ